MPAGPLRTPPCGAPCSTPRPSRERPAGAAGIVADVSDVPFDPSLPRCSWAGAESERADPTMVVYHDEEWGRPCHDDVELFERLALESFQAGLSWSTILHKRDAFRRAFSGFDP